MQIYICYHILSHDSYPLSPARLRTPILFLLQRLCAKIFPNRSSCTFTRHVRVLTTGKGVFRQNRVRILLNDISCTGEGSLVQYVIYILHH